MLPGFRFLFAAIVLSISTLVFGLGAAALLRASHERFASLPAMPSAPVLPSATTADASPPDAATSTLALLQVDTPELDAAAVPRPVPPPAIDDTAPAPDATAEVTTPAPIVSEPKPALPATMASEPSKAADKAEAAATASPIPDAPQAVPEAAATQVETPHPEPTAMVADAAKAEPATPRTPEVALTEGPRPAPLEPADAPIKTAMLAPTAPAPSAIPDPAVAIAGPIPLPRSREWALAQGHAAQRAAKARKIAATRLRPRTTERPPIRSQAQTPAAAPNPLFPFGQ